MRKLYRVLMALPLISLSISVCLAQNTPSFVERKDLKTPEKFKQFHKARYGKDYYLLLTFDRLPGKAEISKLAKHQIKLLELRGKNTYMASLPADLDPGLLKGLNIQSVSAVKADSKLDSRLLSKEYPEWTIEENGKVDIAIVFHDGTSKKTIQDFLKQHNVDVLEDKHRGGATIVARVDERAVVEMAKAPLVSFIDVKQEPIQILNHEVRVNHKVNVLRSGLNGGYNLHGNGVVVGVGDGGELGEHIDFGDRVINKANGTYSSFGDHGDHVSGIIGGAGNLEPKHSGVAPECTIITQKTSQITYNAEEYFNDLGMVLTNNSYGTSFNCTTNGSYNYSAQTLDAQLRALPEVLHIFAAGNSGKGTCDPYPQGYHSVLRYYQSAKNVLTVGMAEEDRTIAKGSSRGPVKDGRLKPEIIGIGRNVISTSREYNYSKKGGTSMSAPAVTGTLALLVEKFRDENNGANPDGALLKAIACNTADDLGNPGPDFIYGFGMINGLRAVETIKQNQFYANDIVHGEMNVQAINVPNGVKQVKVMLYWPDKEAEIYPDKALVNNLDISIITPDGETILPWILDPSPEGVANNAVRGLDTLNNIEQITIDVPAGGMYNILVGGEEVPFGPQRFYVTYDFVYENVLLTHPFGGESFVPGSDELISWDTDITNTSTFKLEYSLDGGNEWVEIEAALAADKRNYRWTIPEAYSPDAMIRVSKNNSNSSSENQVFFNIMGKPENLTATPTCERHMILEWTPSEYTFAYEVCMFDGAKMQVIGTTEENSFVVEEELDLETDYWFAVRSIDMDGNNSERITAISAIPEDIELCPWEVNPVIEHIGLPVYGRVLTASSLNNQAVKMSVRNIGSNDLQNFEIFYSLNGGVPVRETYEGVIASGATQTVEFETKVDLSQVGTYHIDTWLMVEGNNQVYIDSLNSNFYGEQIVNSPVLLPFKEAFTRAVSTTYTKDRLGLEGCVKWDIETDGRGELEVQQGSALILRPTNIGSGNVPISNEAVLTLNMSQYTSMSEVVELSFDYTLDLDLIPFTVMDFENTVSIRGRDTDEWILLRNLERNALEWESFRGLNITEALLENGQQFSTSFQIKFTNDNNLPFALANIVLDKKVPTEIQNNEEEVFDQFTVAQEGSDIVLRWTMTESEGAAFEIETIENYNHTDDFDVIGTILAEGTTTQPFYTFTDIEPGKKGRRYYRIKQINADGTVAFSPVQSVLLNGVGLEGVFPNPFTNQLNLMYEASDAKVIQVLVQDQNGRIIQAAQVDVLTGDQLIPIHIDERQPAGIYYVKIIDGSKAISHKVLKQ